MRRGLTLNPFLNVTRMGGGGGDDFGWSSSNVVTAIAVSIGAGLATGVGGLVVLAPQLLASVPKATVLAVALSVSSGVMLYVSFIEIFVKVLRET